MSLSFFCLIVKEALNVYNILITDRGVLLMKTIVFIGTGNMGSSMIRGIASKAGYRINAYDKDISKAKDLETLTNVKAFADVRDAIEGSDLVVISVKPNVVDSVLESISDLLLGKIVLSIVAGYSLDRFISFLGEGASIVRTIPNLPVLVGEGMTGLYFHNVQDDKRDLVTDIFNSFGKTIVVNKEEDIDKMIGVTSSSPAFISIFVEALADGGVRSGFSRADSYKMALQTVYGTAKLLQDSGIEPALLKDMVSSPGGTTIEGVASLYETGFRNSVLKAMEAVDKKAQDMKKRK